MRILIVDHYYPAFLASVYGGEPGLERKSYADQRARIDDELFGETVFETAALRSLGHEGFDALANVRPLQEAWMSERGLRLSSANRWGLRLRRGIVPWPRRTDSRWIGEGLLAQVKILRPDVIHVQCVDLLGGSLVRELRDHVRLVVGQIAAPLDDDKVLANYDLVVSSLPNFVSRFRAAGMDAEWLPLAFEPSLVGVIGQREREVAVSFVGSLSSHHRARVAMLESVALVADLSVWTGDAHLEPDSPLRVRLKGPAWGKQMYIVMASSKVTLNSHIDVASGFANNLRLFEATGMGALLLTDRGSNLSELFEVGKEVVTYSSAADCAEKVRHYSSHPEEAASIASAGRARTLRDHTWADRMDRLVKLLQTRI